MVCYRDLRISLFRKHKEINSNFDACLRKGICQKTTDYKLKQIHSLKGGLRKDKLQGPGLYCSVLLKPWLHGFLSGLAEKD